jgi:hypothetical protein
MVMPDTHPRHSRRLAQKVTRLARESIVAYLFKINHLILFGVPALEPSLDDNRIIKACKQKIHA